MKTFIKVFMIMLCCGFMATSISNAQTCPDGIAPTNIPWNWNCKYYQMQWPNGNTCETWICYCYRTVNGKVQLYLSSVGAAAPCPGSDWSGTELRLIAENATKELIKDVTISGPCPPCPGGASIEVVDSFCARSSVDSGGNPVMLICPGSSAYCLKTYNRCCDPISGVMTITLISSSGGGVCPTGCTNICY